MSVGAQTFPTPPPPEAPERPEGAFAAPRWPARYAFFALIAGLVTTLVSGGSLAPVIAPLYFVEEDLRDPLLVLVGTAAQDAIFVVTAVAFASVVQPVRAAQFGLRRTRLRRAIGLVALAAAAYVGLSIAWYALAQPGGGGEDPRLLDQTSVAGAVIFGVVVIVVAPLAEEFFFRGFMFQALRNRLGVAGAAGLDGLVFGAAHAGTRPWQYLVPLVLFGVILCLVFQRTRSLWPCVGLHGANNLLAFGLSL